MVAAVMAGCDSPGCCGGGMDRRDFMKVAGAASLFAAAGPSAAGDDPDHFVVAEKKLRKEWVAQLFARGGPAIYEGDDLDRIAMPVGGICAGQVYLTGDGRLAHFDIFNRRNFTGYGRTNYDPKRRPTSPLDQGFSIEVDGKSRTLDRKGFRHVLFEGSYPIAEVSYHDDAFPVAVTLEAFSPFIPLDADESALPVTVMRYTVANRSQKTLQVTLTGRLENAVALFSARDGLLGQRRNRAVRRDGWTMLACDARPLARPQPGRPPVVFADFERGDGYGEWKVEGEAFGKGPAKGTLESQQPVSGFLGKGLVNTYLGGSDRLRGRLTSPEFTIDRPFLSFLVGGGDHAGKTCLNLVVDGQGVVRTATGKRNERLEWHNWDVLELRGKRARLEIVDAETGGWGHINIDQIEFRDTPRPRRSGPLTEQPDFGTMGLALLGLGKVAGEGRKPFGEKLAGEVHAPFALAAGETRSRTFLVAWCFPNRPRNGNRYAARFGDVEQVVAHVAKNFDRLAQQTRRWRDAWYHSTLPRWLLDRLFSTVSTLATSTCQWWRNGRFWAWEGVGCCHGTCAHVWNYEHALARLFPSLERSTREMQDLGSGFVEETGMVRFRGEGWRAWAGDSQAGTVLKAYREHQMAADDAFLRRNWQKIKKALEFLLAEDGNRDGLLEGKQHNTYDIDFFGANTMIGSLYLAALLAGEAMAKEMGDGDFASVCRKIFLSGRRLTSQKLFNGEYFVQDVDRKEHPRHQYGDGCLADQLFGQGWAHQVGLGYVYPEKEVRAALQAIWKYNWATDVGRQNKRHAPERVFAAPGEAGLFTCTWPRSTHPGKAGVRYKNEVWTGIEYQVAGHLAWEGMVLEALALCRAVHERYHPSKHNPYNEVECGDHYARGLASYGVFLGLCGFEYHGPQRHLGLAPRFRPEKFRAAFTAAEGWGTLTQEMHQGIQAVRIGVEWGRLRLKTLALEAPAGAKVKVVTGPKLAMRQDGRRVLLTFADEVVVAEGAALTVTMSF